MLSPEKLKKAYKKVEEENWMMRTFLKGQDPDEVDRIVNKLHEEIFDGFDCVACSNCCKEVAPILETHEIKAVSAKVGVTAAELKNKYLVKTEDGYMIKQKTCPFLTGNGCSIYDCRPENCRKYPYTQKDEIVSRLANLVANCAVCPIVYEIFERLKEYYQGEFRTFKDGGWELYGDGYEYDLEDEDEEYDDFEEWEADVDYFYKQDWAGLVEYRFQQAKKHPDAPEYQWRLGEAYVLNKEYEKAIFFLAGLHKKYPDDLDIQYSLLDALFAVDKDETAVNWIVKPTILRLNNDVLDYCYNFLKPKRKPRTIADLCLELCEKGYMAFKEQQLMEFLRSNDRFTVKGSTEASHDCFVSVVKKI